MFRILTLAMLCIYLPMANALVKFPVHADAAELQQKISIEHKHHFALSKNQKIDGRWRFEKEQVLQGIVIKTLYEIISEDSYPEISAFYQQQINQLDAKVLFHCQGRLCGSSNEWANTLFKDSRLYGSDRNQFFWALEYNQHFWSIYLIQRGNNRIYVHLEEIQPANVDGLMSVALSIPCDIKKDQSLIRTFVANKQQDFFLLYNKAGINTSAESKQVADACALQLKEFFSPIKIRAIGLGEFDRLTKRRVFEDKMELIRFGGAQ
jgi:hypothetical protein